MSGPRPVAGAAIAWGAAAVLAVAVPAPAQTDCARCGGRGEVACPRCDLALERSVEACSVAAACSSCRGTLAIPCRACVRPGVAADPGGRGDRVAGWLARRRAALRRAGVRGRGILLCRTAHLELVFAPARIPSCPTSDPHRQMHLFAMRIVAARRRFVEVLGLRPADLPEPVAPGRTVSVPREATDRSLPSPRLEVWVLRDGASVRRACRQVTGLVHQGIATMRFGARPAMVVLHDPARLADDAALHRNLVHGVVHLLLSHVEPVGWLGEERHGWLDAGIAHFFEASMVDGRCTSFCHLEHGQPPLSFRGGRWLEAARELLEEGALGDLGSLWGKSTSDLTPPEHVLAFAFTTFSIEVHGGAALGRLLREVKRGRASETALAEVYGRTVPDLEKAFHAWLGRAGRRR